MITLTEEQALACLRLMARNERTEIKTHNINQCQHGGCTACDLQMPLLCEDCGKGITPREILNFQIEANSETLKPSTCEDCAELAARTPRTRNTSHVGKEEQ